MTETPSPAIGTKLPLLFTYRDALFGNGFVVEVRAVNGRALCVHENDGFWVYGVNPGAMAAFGDDIESAYAEFCKVFSANLKDFAREARSLDEFRAAVTAFFNESNPGYETDWIDAVRAVRNHEVDDVARNIPKIPAESPRTITVEMKQIFKAEDNEANLRHALAA